MKIRKFMSLCLVIILAIGVSGCMDSSKTRTEKKEQKVLEEMEQHLVDRYGEFEHGTYGVQLNGWDHPYDLCNMYIQQGESEDERDVFAVKRYYNSDTDSYYFTDNYYWYVIRDEYEEHIKQALSNIFPSIQIYLRTYSDDFSDDINGNTTFEEALEIGLPRNMFWIIVNPETMIQDEFISCETQFQEEWGDKRGSINFRVFFPESKKIYNQINRYNQNDYLKNFVYEINN